MVEGGVRVGGGGGGCGVIWAMPKRTGVPQVEGASLCRKKRKVVVEGLPYFGLPTKERTIEKWETRFTNNANMQQTVSVPRRR